MACIKYRTHKKRTRVSLEEVQVTVAVVFGVKKPSHQTPGVDLPVTFLDSAPCVEHSHAFAESPRQPNYNRRDK